MIKRVLSSLIGLPVLVMLIILGGLPLKITISAIIILAMFEVYRAFSKKISAVHFVGYVFACIYMLFADQLGEPYVLPLILMAFTLSVLIISTLFSEKISMKDSTVTVFGFCYVAILMSTIYLIRISTYGIFFVWLSFIAAWGCDTGAYFVGVTIGKNKLVPKLSPKKTIEGAIGGVTVATILAAVYGITVSTLSTTLDINIVSLCAIAGFVGSILAQFGDLTASHIKRYTDIKDYGKIIPGHGGIMDRFDSVLFTAPAIYIVMIIMKKI